NERLSDLFLGGVEKSELALVEAEEIPDFLLELEAEHIADRGFGDDVALDEDGTEALVGFDLFLEGEDFAEGAALDDATMDKQVAKAPAAFEGAGVDDATGVNDQGDFTGPRFPHGEQAGAFPHADELEDFR